MSLYPNSNAILYNYPLDVEENILISKLYESDQQSPVINHDVIVTGVVYDDVLDEYFYIISSWGKRYVIKSKDIILHNIKTIRLKA